MMVLFYLKELNPIMEEEISNDEEEIRDCRDTIKSSNGVDKDQSSSVELPSVPDAKKEGRNRTIASAVRNGKLMSD